jgi:hypothetical protein
VSPARTLERREPTLTEDVDGFGGGAQLDGVPGGDGGGDDGGGPTRRLVMPPKTAASSVTAIASASAGRSSVERREPARQGGRWGRVPTGMPDCSWQPVDVPACAVTNDHEVGTPLARVLYCRSAALHADVRDRSRDRSPDTDRIMDRTLSDHSGITSHPSRRRVQPATRRRRHDAFNGHLGSSWLVLLRGRLGVGGRDRCVRLHRPQPAPTSAAASLR